LQRSPESPDVRYAKEVDYVDVDPVLLKYTTNEGVYVLSFVR